MQALGTHSEWIVGDSESAQQTAVWPARATMPNGRPRSPGWRRDTAVEQACARRLLEILLPEKRLVRISEDLVFHRSAIDKLRGPLAPRKATRFNVGAFKEWTGVSRKYAIPLLEFLDRERVTLREGDERLVL